MQALVRAPSVRMSAATLVETAAVVDGDRDPVLSARLDELIGATGIEIEPLTRQHADIARQAYRDYGRGSGHSARLNLGDCFAYALARARSEPLLYTGQDFGLTDIASAMQTDA